MGDIVHLPGSAPRPGFRPTLRPSFAAPELPETGGRRGSYGLGDIARQLKIDHFHDVRTIIDKLRAMARHEGMPLPETPRVVKGRPVRGPDMIYRKSLWDAGKFDAWLDGRGPTAPAAPVPTPVRRDMAQRAQLMACAG